MNKRNILFTLQTGLIILINGCTDTSLAQNKNGCIRLGDETGPLIIWPYGNKLVNLGHGKFKVTNRFTSQSTLIGEEISISGGLYEVKFAQVTPSIPHTCVNHGYWLSGPTNIN